MAAAGVLLLACGEADAPPEPGASRLEGSSDAGSQARPEATAGDSQPHESAASQSGLGNDRATGPSSTQRVAGPGATIAPAGELAARAQEAWDSGDMGGALTLLSRAVADRPESADARSRFGRHLMAATAYDLAREHLEKAAELSPNDGQVQLDLLTLYEKLADDDRAGRARERAESLAGGKPIGQDERGFYRFE